MEKERVMKWEIDTKTKHLSLDGNYHISFDRLTEDDWFLHLSEKNWVDMKKILPAFVSAYDAAGLNLDKDFFRRYKKAFMERAEDDYVVAINDAWNKKCYGDRLLMNSIGMFRPSELCIDDLISHKEPVNA
jgi:hypothetical protein